MAYPAAVVAYWMVLRANEQSDDSPRAHFRLDANGRYLPADIAVTQAGHYSPGVERLAYALERLSDREDVRDSHSRYEACGLTLASAREGGNARFTELPGPGTILDVDRMFRRIYEIYDRRFVYQAPALAKRTRRLEWHAESEILVSTVVGNMDFEELAPRLRA